MSATALSVPVIDISSLIDGRGNDTKVPDQLAAACREYGFFYISGHGISQELQQRLEEQSAAFFARPLEEKMKISMPLGGRAWRGFFPVGDELTSGKPDLKEGLYFGSELGNDHPLVQAGTPMHGANLFPDDMPGFRTTVLEYIDALTQLGHQLMRGLALSLGLEASYFAERYTGDPLTLFRIFHYPPGHAYPDLDAPWGVGEHTDYGVLTILKQDPVGGLQIKSGGRWIDAPYLPGTFVCNIGDMLDRMTKGYYRSTPHRVLNTSGKGRFSFPFFFDPNFGAHIAPIDLGQVVTADDDRAERWDGASVHEFEGTYGDYILNKVSKVFPQLRQNI
jgi:isopenicillin N synthase-like dioxygenase